MIAAIVTLWACLMAWLYWRMTRRNYWELTRYRDGENADAWRNRWEQAMLDQAKRENSK